MALALVAVAVPLAEPVYWWAMTHRAYFESRRSMISFFFSSRGPIVRGWKEGPRWSTAGWPGSSHVRGISWYIDSGFKAEQIFVRDGKLCMTKWKPDGSVRRQDIGIQAGKDQSQDSPPWLWGVTDQTTPTMPAWMKDDAQWQAALDAQE